MFTKAEKLFGILFFIIVILELFSGLLNRLETFHYFTKPSIVISLIIALISFSRRLHSRIKHLIFCGLLFSLIGDFLLMFVDHLEQAFLFGLMAFLVAHVCYCLAFWKQRDQHRSVWLPILALLLYAFIIFYTLKNNLGTLILPVIIYMLVILTMAVLAYLRKRTVGKLGYHLVLWGALLFILSDSLLAVNKFAFQIPLSHLAIMLPYALAQFGIVFGIIKSNM